LQRAEEQGSSGGNESAGPRRRETDSERNARVQQDPPDVRLPASLRANCHQHAAAGGFRDLLSRSIQSFRNSAALGKRGAEQSLENDAAALRYFSGYTRARRIQLPGNGARSDGAEGRVLAGADHRCAIEDRLLTKSVLKL